MPLVKLKSIWLTLVQTFEAWDENDAPRMGAALAFYTILSLAPLVILAVAMSSWIFGGAAAQERLLWEVDGMIGHEGAAVVKGMMEQGRKPGSGVIATVVGAVTIIFGASGVFSELRSALNRIWGVKPKKNSGIWSTVHAKFFSFGMVLAVGFLLLVSLVISAGLAALGKFFGDFLPASEFILGVINFIVSLFGIAGLFALIFRYVPEMRVAWRDIRSGALLTALMFTIGKSLIGLYLGKAAVGSAYGAAGSLVVLTVWVYYSALIFLFGAELTQVMSIEEIPPDLSTDGD